MKRKDYCDRWIEEFIDGVWVARPEPPAPQIDDELEYDEDEVKEGESDV